MKHIRLYVFLYFTAKMALDVVYRSLDHVTRGQPAEWAPVFIEQATGYYGALLLLPGILWAARRWPFRLRPAHIGLYALLTVVCSALHTSMLWGSRSALFPLFGLGPYDYGDMHVRYFMEFPSDIIGCTLILGAYAAYRHWLRAKDLETQLVSARLDNLSRQLQPHFLFNALNAVSAAMYEDRARADRMLERICGFLRATLRLPDSPMVPVSTELALARQYLEVMQARLEDRLHFEIQCDPKAESVSVPALLLQPLVENAVEHGHDRVSGRLDIGIGARRNGAFLEITIRDHGPGLWANGAGPKTDGHGLYNARRRLKTVYGDQAALRLADHFDGGALIEIQVPV